MIFTLPARIGQELILLHGGSNAGDGKRCMVLAWFQPGLISAISSMAPGGLLVMAPAIVAAFFWRRAAGPPTRKLSLFIRMGHDGYPTEISLELSQRPWILQ